MPISDDVKHAWAALTEKQPRYDLLWSYYMGKPPIRYVADRLYEVFGYREARFSQNWAAVVIDAEAERIRLNGFTVTDDDALGDALNDLFEDTELHLDADDVTTAVLVCGEAFVVVWPDEDGAIEAVYNDPRLCHVVYDADHPRRKRYAAKWWVDGDGKRRLNMYYPDRIEYYISTKKAGNVSSANGLQPMDPPTAPNPYGVVPVFHYRRDRRGGQSALANVIEPADAINKLTQDMMVAAEFGAFKQRWAITDADVGPLKNAPNEIWSLPSGDGDGQGTSVGEFSATELANYLNAMDKLAYNIAIITRTPKHYFMGQGGDPSGEALIAMEAPLNKKAQATIDRLTQTWRQVAAFMLELAGQSVEPRAITPLFDRPETVQPRTEAEIREINNRAGIPLVTTLRNQGWTDAEIDQMAEDRAEADERTARAETRSFVNEFFPPEAPNGTPSPNGADTRTAANGAAAIGAV